MGKELSEMTLEELWDLFPIFLVQHDDQWNGYYEEIEAVITDLLKDYQIKRISHIGSTAIQGIWAKNIVDVMVVCAFSPAYARMSEKQKSRIKDMDKHQSFYRRWI